MCILHCYFSTGCLVGGETLQPLLDLSAAGVSGGNVVGLDEAQIDL